MIRHDVARAAAADIQKPAFFKRHGQFIVQQPLFSVDRRKIRVRREAEHRQLLVLTVIGHVVPVAGLLRLPEDDADTALERKPGAQNVLHRVDAGDGWALVVADAAAVKPPVFFGQVIGRMAPAGTGRHDIQMRKDPDHGFACADLRPAAAVIFAQLRFKAEPAAQLQRVVQSLRAACAVWRIV